MVSRTVTRAEHWLQASRPLAQVNIGLPLILGQAAAWHVHGMFSATWLVASLMWGAIDHLFVVFGNDYADHRSDDGTRTLISGGSGVIVERKLSARAVGRAAIGAASSLFVLSCVLALGGRPWTPVYAIAALLLLWFYSFNPARLSYRGGGELLQGIGMGVGLPSLGFYLQTREFFAPLWILVPATLLGVCANILTALPDVESDTRAEKRTWPVRTGVPMARRAARLGIALAALIAFYWTPAVSIPMRALVGVVPLIPLLVSWTKTRALASAWWASIAIHALLTLWIVALST